MARRNGARSKGPATSQAKARSSNNSLKHGLSAKQVFVLANETEESFIELMNEFQREHNPRTTLENELVVELTFAWWRLRRLHSIETGLFDKTMAAQASTVAQRHGVNADEFRLAEAFEALTGGSDALKTLSQYESRLFGTFNRILNRLATLHAERMRQPAECKNEPTDPAPCTTPSSNVKTNPKTRRLGCRILPASRVRRPEDLAGKPTDGPRLHAISELSRRKTVAPRRPPAQPISKFGATLVVAGLQGYYGKR